MTLTVAAAAPSPPIALGGYDPVACGSAAASGTPCTAKGNASFSTMYTSMDKDGTERFTSTFLFTSADNMIAFENSPFLYAPKYGGFCAHGLSSMSNASVWSREKLGPPVDLTKAWRVVDQPAGSGGLSQALVLFKDEQHAEEFIKALPGSQQRADAVWNGWWGAHGTVPPYAQHAGPFNQECFVGSGRDCSKQPQPLPPIA